MALPPGPPFPKLVQGLLLWHRTLPTLDWCRRRYGDVFTVWIPPLGACVYVADPEEIKAVFAGDPAVFHAGEGNAVLSEILGPASVLVLDEERHLRQRKLMLPPFHGENVRRYGQTMADVAAAEVERWPVGSPFRLHPRLRAITLEVILSVVIGVEGARRDELRRLLPRLSAISPLIQLMILRPELERVGPWRRYRALQRRIDALLFDEIADRRADPRLGEREDVLSMLVAARDEDGGAMSDAELRDEVITLLVAGHETTTTGLAWVFERLLRTPAALARARELDDEYLDAVVQETLRVRPVISDVVRKLTRDTEVAGHVLPAGANVLPAISLVQSDPRHHPDPQAFRPERFLDGSPAPNTWIPFGGGRRRCLGAAFASFEMRTVLRTVLERAELRPARPEPEAIRPRHVTQVPARGAEAVLVRRSAMPAVEPAPA
ncbi:MAG: cytochrome P450 [Thermoleophilaceae bacterium]